MWYLYDNINGEIYGPFAEESMVQDIVSRTGDRYEPFESLGLERKDATKWQGHSAD